MNTMSTNFSQQLSRSLLAAGLALAGTVLGFSATTTPAHAGAAGYSAKLATALDKTLAKHGFPAADHDFEPHLTLGRVRTPADWTERLVKTPSPEVRFKVGKIVLVQSALAPGGSRYDVVGEALLGK